jgi:mono/diheme cytochrome c family protein
LVEIPEHLLKRSRERRAALGLGGGEAPSEGGAATESASPASATPAETASAAPAKPAFAPPPAEPEPEPPKPEPAYVQAAHRRRRIPYWAMPVLAGIPVWAYMFAGTLSPQPVEDDPLTLGGELYASSGCAGCHGGSGQGGAGPAFADGAVVETWPDFRDQMMWVRVGTDGWLGDTYGATQKPVGGGGTMPSHPALSDQELAQVVLYERRELAGEEAPPEADDQLLQIAAGEMTFAEAGLGDLSTEAGFTEADLEGGG